MASSSTATASYVPNDFAQQIQYVEMTDPPQLSVQTYSLPPLPYAYTALEPHISAEIMVLHHDKHHQAYVTNLNAALSNYSKAVADANIPDQIALQNLIKFNGGGHINHSLFWKNLAPADTKDASEPEGSAPSLVKNIKSTFGSLAGFTTAFSAALMGIQGSGWGWLVKAPGEEGGLRIVTTKDQDPVVGGEVPIIGIDMWEHAYYLQYQNGKMTYIDNVWKIINWTSAEERFQGSHMSVDAVEELKSSLKQLYYDPEFSDLTIASCDFEYRVHKAIVCPRSAYFAKQCRDVKSKAASDGYLNLSDDDPQAVGMAVRYFYHLDYPSESSDRLHANGLPNSNGQNNGHATDDDGPNESVKSDDQPIEKDAKSEDLVESLDDFLPPQPQRLSKKQKKRAKAHAKENGVLGSPSPQGDSVSSLIAIDSSLSQTQENHNEGGGAVLEAKQSPAHRVEEFVSKSNGVEAAANKSLVLHANVYALSRKYDISGLRSLAFDKFKSEADSQWQTEEFLHAANKIYTSCSDCDDDRKMKDVVVGMITRHGELMDQAEMQKVMRTLPKDMMFDILMQVRQQGGFSV
ncbi:BTB/POZ domain-containing protein [Colletotrichum karsti]|uniref:Superoxide dismutase [Mn], mitochondrial n=1 Tax=Colletotrichum karsti TaxID=1095194 RepID=A0A9P6HS93_9PEZI|nr:BTB/POZ domain-containing protein [Colletotrichum karsti]KAF9869403.1 BTB/POZ domain-containing protein [Colletotrichum karsti]